MTDETRSETSGYEREVAETPIQEVVEQRKREYLEAQEKVDKLERDFSRLEVAVTEARLKRSEARDAYWRALDKVDAYVNKEEYSQAHQEVMDTLFNATKKSVNDTENSK